MAIAVVAAGALVAASLAAGAIGGSSPVNACVSAKSGAARVVATGARCRRGERSLRWNVLGATGARGRTGAPGDVGPSGLAGADGASGTAGATGAGGAKGERGTFNFDSFQGMSCVQPNSQPGTIGLTYGASGQVTFTCA